jgi:hypothetical protein
MIKDMNMNGQHKRALFMISLPQTAEFETCKDYVSDCINKLSERGVDVCESIHREDLATISQYNIVIIVAHHDTDDDALLLADGKLSMDDFVNSIPKDFCGELDFSSCYSASAMKAIKDRCPDCHVQASIHQTTLALRLMAYPFVIDLINEDEQIEYHDAYMKVLDMILQAASEVPEDDEELELVKLGEEKTSVYSPREVMRNSVFQILVFFHYDSENEVVKAKAIRRQNDAEISDEFDIPISLKKDDKIAITLSFESTDNANIKVKNDEYTKYVTLKKEIVEEEFIITLLPDFQCNSFLAQIEFAKDGECFVRTKYFNIKVTDHINKVPADIEMEIPQYPEKPEDIIKCYADVFTGRIFDYDSNSGNYSNFQQILSKKNADSDKLHFIRRFIYNNDFFLIQLKKFVDSSNNELSNLLKEDSKDKTVITWDIVPLLKGCIIKIQERLDSLETKFKSVKIKARGTLNYDEALPKIPSLESKFIDLSSEIKYIDYQIQMLKIYKELRDNLNKYSKEVIKESASDFWEYPHKHLVDQGLFDILRTKCDVGAIKHPKSGGDRGVTMPYLALLLAMVCGEYISVDNGKEDWDINIANYIDLSNYTKSLRTPKNRINKFIGVLKSQDVRDSISQYMKTKVGKMSVSAVLLLKIKV